MKPMKEPMEGSIPACAGEPLESPAESVLLTVYPRVCGGTCDDCAMAVAVDGLSPRVRGNRTFPSRGMCASWSIPACAGEPTSRG